MLAVLDCMVFAQALINPNGPAGACVVRGAQRDFTILLSREIVAEILELPQKLPAKYDITDDKVTALLDGVAPAALMLAEVPCIFTHPVDPDDSPYVNAAIARARN